MLDRVRVVRGRQTIKEGIIVGITNCGAKVYDDKATDEPPFCDSVFFAEWFPFQSAEQRLAMVKAHIVKKKAHIKV